MSAKRPRYRNEELRRRLVDLLPHEERLLPEHQTTLQRLHQTIIYLMDYAYALSDGVLSLDELARVTQVANAAWHAANDIGSPRQVDGILADAALDGFVDAVIAAADDAKKDSLSLEEMANVHGRIFVSRWPQCAGKLTVNAFTHAVEMWRFNRKKKWDAIHDAAREAGLGPPTATSMSEGYSRRTADRRSPRTDRSHRATAKEIVLGQTLRGRRKVRS